MTDLSIKVHQSEQFREHNTINWAIGLIQIGDQFFPTSLEKVDSQGEAKLKMIEDRRRKVFKNLDPAFEMIISIYTLKHTSEETKPKSASEKIGSFFSRKSSSRSSRKSINPINFQSTSQSSAISTVSRVGTMTRAVLGPD